VIAFELFVLDLDQHPKLFSHKKYGMKKFEDMNDEEKWNAARIAMDNAERRISGLETWMVILEDEVKKLKNQS